MVSIPLFVLLLATYAYSVPVGINDNISAPRLEISTSKPMIMHLLDDGEAINVPTHSSDLQMTTPRSLLNKERAARGMAELEWGAQGVKESSKLFPTLVETSSQSEHHPSGLVESSTLLPLAVETSSRSEHWPRGLVESSTLLPLAVETSSRSEHWPRGLVESSTLLPSAMETSSKSEHWPRGLVESSTLLPSAVETSSKSEHWPRGLVESSTLLPSAVETSSRSEHWPRGLVESSTLYPSTVETSSQFNERKIRGQNVLSRPDLQTTEEPSSSVSSFAKTTGLLQNQRGEQVEEHESTSMTMDEATTEVSSTGRSNTVIEVIPGRNSKTEIIPGRNTKTEIIPGRHTETEIIPGLNTKTEISTSGSGRFVVGNRVLSQGKNQPINNKKESNN